MARIPRVVSGRDSSRQEPEEPAQDQHDPHVGKLQAGRRERVQGLRSVAGVVVEPRLDRHPDPVQHGVVRPRQPVEQVSALADQPGRRTDQRLALVDDDRDQQVHQSDYQHDGGGEHDRGRQPPRHAPCHQLAHQRVQDEHDHGRNDQVGEDVGQAGQRLGQGVQDDGRPDPGPGHHAPSDQPAPAAAGRHQSLEMVADGQPVDRFVHGSPAYRASGAL